jgi:pimeloyl-ACP methyl ester carboxylesterase
MHGGSGSLDDTEAGWAALIPQFATRNRVLALEHRGHGRTRNPGRRFGYDLFAADLRAFITGLGLGPFQLRGRQRRRHHRPAPRPREPGTAAQHVVASAPTSASTTRSWRPCATPSLRRSSASTPSGRPAWPIGPTFTEDDLARIGVPALFVEGEADPFANTDQMIAFKRHVPGAEWLIINNAWHTVQHTHADVLGPRVLDFLTRHDNAATTHPG